MDGTAEKASDATSPQPLSAKALLRPLNLVLLLLVTLLVAVGFQFRIERIRGDSMAPTFGNGTRVIVERFSYRFREPQYGDILVINLRAEDWFLASSTGGFYLKRVVGLPGDSVEVRAGRIHVNGVALEPPYATQGVPQTMAPATVPEGRLFLLGDNYASSTDSRSFGPVPTDRIIGRVWFALW